MTLVNLADAPNLSVQVAADICVIGAGPAGLIAASSLARSGKKVVLLESGPIAPGLDDLNAVETGALNYRGPLVGRKRGLGGTSDLWGGRLIPLTEHDVSARPYAGLPAWPISHGEIYRHLPDVERLFALSGGANYEGLPQLHPTALAGADADEDVHCRSPKIVSFRRRNVFLLLEAELQASKNLAVYSGATVTNFDLDEERGCVRSARASGDHQRSITVMATEFIIAAGTIESTRLLLLMKRRSNDHAFHGNEAVGNHFVDHLAMDIGSVRRFSPAMISYLIGHTRSQGLRRAAHFEVSPQVQQAATIGSAYMCLRLDFESNPLNLVRDGLRRRVDRRNARVGTMLASSAAIVHAGLWRTFHPDWLLPDSIRIAAEIRIEQLPNGGNRIRLSHQLDAMGVPKAHIDWSTGEVDLRTTSHALGVYRRFWQDRALSSACAIDWSLAADAPIEDPSLFRDVYHPSGSTRMGSDQRNSVVDINLRCHAIPNAHILSPSVFPSAGSANPMLTLACLAYRLAASLSAH